MWRVIYKESPLLFFFFLHSLVSRKKSQNTYDLRPSTLSRKSRVYIVGKFSKKNDTLSASARAHAHAHAHARTKKKGDVEKAESKSLLLRTRERREWDRTVALHDQ